MSNHVVVIGGGVAGCMAALAAKSRGASVTLVSRSAGATAISTGGVVLDGITERTEAIDALSRAANLVERPDEYLLATGAVIRADLVGTSHARGALSGLKDRSVLVIGIPGHPAINAADLARRLTAHGAKATAADVTLEGAKRTFDLPAFPIARLFDDPKIAGNWAKAVAAEKQKGSFDLVALPPVMGLENAAGAASALTEHLSDSWFELLSAPPTVPGMRLWLDLNLYVKKSGVTLLHADVKHATIKGDVITDLRAWDGETAHRLSPDQVVLATGRHITGGITLTDQVVESLFGLPTTGDAADSESRQQAGVPANPEHRPIDGSGTIPVSNLRLGGSIRAGASYARGDGGIGLAAETGWAAGSAAADATVQIKDDAAISSIEALARPGEEGCLGCEMCASVCPVLNKAAVDGPWYPGPRGLTSLGRSGPLLEASGDPLSLCTLCGACSSICPAGGKNYETVASLRAELLERNPEAAPEPHRVLPEVLAKHGNVYGTELEPLEGPRREDAEIAFFPGCSLSYFERESARNTIKLLEALEIPFSVVDGVCCGGPLDVLGLDTPSEAVEKNREAVAKTGAKTVVATCPRCTHRLSHDLDLPDVKVEHTLELLDRVLADSAVLPKLKEKLSGQSVTYHDPCEMGRYRGLYEEARRVLELVGVQVTEMARHHEQSACCGAGGGLRAVNPKLSRELSRRRVSEAMDTGADHLLTECPSCLHNLRTGRKRKQKIEVEDLTGFLGDAL